jgi:hypothetical protein
LGKAVGLIGLTSGMRFTEATRKMGKWAMVMVATMASWVTTSAADWTDARCDIYPAGEDHASAMVPCVFGQRQGAVTITRSDGITHDLVPVGDTPGNYRDSKGQPAYRQSGLGDQGLIFRLENQSVYVYWDTSALTPPSSDDRNWSAPFTTADYDATTRLPCRAAGDAKFGSCPAGVLRMDAGQASIVVRTQLGEQFTINFMRDYVNAANRKIDAVLKGDTWVVTTENGDVYEVPLAAIEGG